MFNQNELETALSDGKEPGYKPPDSFRKQTQDRGNKKPVSDETCLTYLSVGSMLQSKI